MSFDWKRTLGALAPVIGTAVGGPFGAIAGQMVGEVFGHEGDTPPTEREMAQYIEKATPDQIVKLKELDTAFQVRMEELGVTREQLSYADTADARDMQKKNNSWFPAALCALLTLGFFGSLYLMMTVEVPEPNKAVVFTMVGSLGTAWVASIQFWFGTTKGSSDKTDLLSRMK